MKAVTVSEFEIVNRAASAPDEMVTVADSETLIVAAADEIAMFSAAENDEEELKIGAVVSGIDGVIMFTYPIPVLLTEAI
jgi:hypothetical protein